MRLWLLLSALFVATTANAEWTNRPQFGIGFTDNANYEDTDKNADTFWWVRNSTSLTEGSSRYNLWLNYRGYLKEHQNDVFNYRLGDTMAMRSSAFGNYDWDIGVGGQQYTEGNPATTEETFNNVYVETAATKTWVLRRDLEASLEPLYQLKYFPSLSGRTDNTFLLNGGMDWQFHPIQSLNPFAEFGMVFSNQSAFTKNYLEFGSDWRIIPQPDLKYILHFVSRYSAFPNRPISETTVFTNRNGKVRSSSQNEIETLSFVQFQGSIVKMIRKAELRGAVGATSQTSRSGYENFTETQVQTSISVPL